MLKHEKGLPKAVEHKVRSTLLTEISVYEVYVFPWLNLRDLSQTTPRQKNTKVCVYHTLDFILYHVSTSLCYPYPFPPLPMHPSVSIPVLVPVIFAVTLSTSFIHSLLLILLLWTHTHISPTDCLSSIFCSTPHHNTNRWITFLAPELCTNISWLREQERMKNVNTRALQAIDRISQSHTVSLVGIHYLLHPLNVVAVFLSLILPLYPSLLISNWL